MRKIILLILSLGLLAMASSACSSKGNTPDKAAPQKPAGVPQDAQWAHAQGGWVWVECRKVPDRPELRACSVYGKDGKKLQEGEFELFPYSNMLPDTFEYQQYNGEKITLTDNRMLRPVGVHEFPETTGKRDFGGNGMGP